LTDAEQVVAEVSYLLHQRLAKGGGYVRACYFFAFLLRKYLREEKGIEVSPVVGWASTGDVLFGHAWAEFAGKRIDLSLTQTTEPRIAPPGDLLILDRVFQSGRASYVYHAETTDQILGSLQRDGLDGQRRIIFANQMRRVAADDAAIDRYFAEGPHEYRYDAVRARLQ
jgi:hypothetical protein